MQACRICLNTNSRFYHVSKHGLQTLYEDITGYCVSPSDGLPQYFCFECSYRLHTSVKFKRKAITSCNLLTDLLKTNVNLNKRILNANCKKHNFESTLCAKHFKANYYDLELDEDEKNDEYKIDDLIDDVTPPLDDDEVNSYKDFEDEIEYKDENEPNDIDIDIKNEDSNHSFYISDDTSSSDEVLAKKKTVVKKKKVIKKAVTKKVSSEKVGKARQRFKQIISEDIFTITDLSPDEQMQDILKRKESRNFKYSEFKCTECYKGFLDQEAYKSHMIRHTDQSGPYVCDVCKVHFRNKYAVRNHAKAHLQKFSCRQCPYVTSRRHAAILHEKYHNGTKYQCPHCKEEFSIAGTYMSHVRLKHTSRHVCLLCGHTFVSDKGLELHTQLKHRFEDIQIPEDGPFCEQCSLRFASDEALQRHMITSAVHNLNGESREALSKKSHLNKTDGRKQRKRCKPDDPITCEQCDAQLPDSLSYFRHFRRQHPDKNRTHYPSKRKSQAMCEVCGKLFQSLALLQDHSWTHTDSKPFKCNQCNKSFQRKYRLIAHRRIHGNQRTSYACTVCGKRFSTSSNMQRHMFSHTGLKPFKCEMCGKCFKHSSEKRAHITYVHLKKPWPKRSRGKRPDERQPQMQSSMAPDIDIVQPLWPACTM